MRIPKNDAPPARTATETRAKFKPDIDAPQDNTASAQRARLLCALRRGPITTVSIRRDLDILQPMARVLELRQAGHRIVTAWTYQETAQGRTHRVGMYCLLAGREGESDG
jgi:hypothetical protein